MFFFLCLLFSIISLVCFPLSWYFCCFFFKFLLFCICYYCNFHVASLLLCYSYYFSCFYTLNNDKFITLPLFLHVYFCTVIVSASFQYPASKNPTLRTFLTTQKFLTGCLFIVHREQHIVLFRSIATGS